MYLLVSYSVFGTFSVDLKCCCAELYGMLPLLEIDEPCGGLKLLSHGVPTYLIFYPAASEL